MKRYFPFFIILVILGLTFAFPSIEYDKTIKSAISTPAISPGC
jgi:Amt family ammonium transporter